MGRLALRVVWVASKRSTGRALACNVIPEPTSTRPQEIRASHVRKIQPQSRGVATFSPASALSGSSRPTPPCTAPGAHRALRGTSKHVTGLRHVRHASSTHSSPLTRGRRARRVLMARMRRRVRCCASRAMGCSAAASQRPCLWTVGSGPLLVLGSPPLILPCPSFFLPSCFCPLPLPLPPLLSPPLPLFLPFSLPPFLDTLSR